jgi:hypothetical protein
MSTMLNTLLHPLHNGQPVSIVTGRDLADLEATDGGRIIPLLEVLRERLWDQGHVLVEFSRSFGLRADCKAMAPADQTAMNDILARLSQVPADRPIQEDRDMRRFNALLTGLLELARQGNAHKLADGRPMRLVVLVHYSEHLIAKSDPAHKTDLQVRALEGVLELSKSLAFRRSGHALLLSEARPQLMDELLYRHLATVTVPQPNATEKADFAEALVKRYPAARLDSTNVQEVSHAASNTPNRSLEGIWSAADRERNSIDLKQVFERKQRDIGTLSEGTLVALDQESNKRIELTGAMVERAYAILMRVAEGIRRGDRSTMRNLLLVGPPSSGKTQLAMLVAALAGVPAFELVTGRSMYVGESERKTRLQLGLLREQGHCMGLIDEVEHMLPMDRTKDTHDGGVTQSIMGMYQTFLADSSLSGRLAIVATSNRPFAISDAMRQRWIVVPVFSALAGDMPEIIRILAARLGLGDLDAAVLQDAAKRFHSNGASPREIRESIIAARSVAGEELPANDVIRRAAASIIGVTDQGSTVLGDLAALQFCRSSLMLPWHDAATGEFLPDFPLPEHIKPFVDPATGSIDQQELGKTVAMLRSQVNI